MSYPASAYANIALVPPSPKRSAVARKTAALESRSEEARLKKKIEQANTILDRLEARAAEQAAVIKAMGKRKAATLAKIERIEDAILTQMDEAGLKQIAGIRCSMRSQPAAAALEVLDETLVPSIYFNTPKAPPPTVDKVALKKALAADDELNPRDWGCKLTSKISLIRK